MCVQFGEMHPRCWDKCGEPILFLEKKVVETKVVEIKSSWESEILLGTLRSSEV